LLPRAQRYWSLPKKIKIKQQTTNTNGPAPYAHKQINDSLEYIRNVYLQET